MSVGLIFGLIPILIGFFGLILATFTWNLQILTGSIFSLILGVAVAYYDAKYERLTESQKRKLM